MSDEQRIQAGPYGDDYVDVERYDGEIHLTINQPYAGDTETGLHRSANVTLTPDHCVDRAPPMRKPTIDVLRVTAREIERYAP